MKANFLRQISRMLLVSMFLGGFAPSLRAATSAPTTCPVGISKNPGQIAGATSAQIEAACNLTPGASGGCVAKLLSPKSPTSFGTDLTTGIVNASPLTANGNMTTAQAQAAAVTAAGNALNVAQNLGNATSNYVNIITNIEQYIGLIQTLPNLYVNYLLVNPYPQAPVPASIPAGCPTMFNPYVGTDKNNKPVLQTPFSATDSTTACVEINPGGYITGTTTPITKALNLQTGQTYIGGDFVSLASALSDTEKAQLMVGMFQSSNNYALSRNAYNSLLPQIAAAVFFAAIYSPATAPMLTAANGQGYQTIANYLTDSVTGFLPYPNPGQICSTPPTQSATCKGTYGWDGKTRSAGLIGANLNTFFSFGNRPAAISPGPTLDLLINIARGNFATMNNTSFTITKTVQTAVIGTNGNPVLDAKGNPEYSVTYQQSQQPYGYNPTNAILQDSGQLNALLNIARSITPAMMQIVNTLPAFNANTGDSNPLTFVPTFLQGLQLMTTMDNLFFSCSRTYPGYSPSANTAANLTQSLPIDASLYYGTGSNGTGVPQQQTITLDQEFQIYAKGLAQEYLTPAQLAQYKPITTNTDIVFSYQTGQFIPWLQSSDGITIYNQGVILPSQESDPQSDPANTSPINPALSAMALSGLENGTNNALWNRVCANSASSPATFAAQLNPLVASLGVLVGPQTAIATPSGTMGGPTMNADTLQGASTNLVVAIEQAVATVPGKDFINNSPWLGQTASYVPTTDSGSTLSYADSSLVFNQLQGFDAVVDPSVLIDMATVLVAFAQCYSNYIYNAPNKPAWYAPALNQLTVPGMVGMAAGMGIFMGGEFVLGKLALIGKSLFIAAFGGAAFNSIKNAISAPFRALNNATFGKLQKYFDAQTAAKSAPPETKASGTPNSGNSGNSGGTTPVTPKPLDPAVINNLNTSNAANAEALNGDINADVSARANLRASIESNLEAFENADLTDPDTKAAYDQAVENAKTYNEKTTGGDPFEDLPEEGV